MLKNHPTRRQVLGAAAAGVLLSGFGPEMPSLRQAAEQGGRRYGAAVQLQQLQDDPHFAQRFARECGVLVPEQEMKFWEIHPEADRFEFERTDKLVRFAQKHGQQVRGHTLIWYKDFARLRWLREALTYDTAEVILADHITRIMQRYRGKISSWDVVNEALAAPDGRADGLRRTQYLDVLGPRYIPFAFQLARAADPTAELVYNETTLSSARPNSITQRNLLLHRLDDWQKAGAPIDGIGIQSHLRLDSPMDNAAVGRFVRELHTRGLKVLVTELDVNVSGGSGDAAALAQQTSDFAESYLEAVLANAPVETVITWGLSDRYSWLNYDRLPPKPLQPAPLPLDRRLRRKPMALMLKRLLRQARR